MSEQTQDEWGWWPGIREPVQFSFASSRSWLIVRRIAEQYVNVRLRREAAAHFTTLGKFNNPHGYHDHLVDACREALRERCGYMLFGNPIPCTRDRGHAGEHGVTDDLCGMTYGQSNVERKCVRKPHHFGSHTDDERYAKV